MHFFKSIPDIVREDEEIPQTLFEFLKMPEREKYNNNNNITLIVPLFLKHINYNYLILLKNLLNIIFFEKFKILINDNINYGLKCNFIDKKRENIIKILLNKYEYEIDVLKSNKINVMQLIDVFYYWKKDHNNIYSIICITDLDIYEEGNENNTIFGRATGDRICIISLYHHKMDNLQDLLETLFHECCHSMIGIDHCVFFRCIMNAKENIDEYIIKRYNNLLKLINDKVNKKYLNTK